ncbi:hypothetical protein V9R55_003486 [Vibrio cholerae]
MQVKAALLATSLFAFSTNASETASIEYYKDLITQQNPTLKWDAKNSAKPSLSSFYFATDTGVSVVSNIERKGDFFASADAAIEHCATIMSTLALRPNDVKVKTDIKQLIIRSFDKNGEKVIGRFYGYEFSSFTLDMATHYALTCMIHKI